MNITLKRNKGSLLTVKEMDYNLSELYYNRVTLNTQQVINGEKTFSINPSGIDDIPNNPKQAITTKCVDDNINSEVVISYDSPSNPDNSLKKVWIKITADGYISDYYLKDYNSNTWNI